MNPSSSIKTYFYFCQIGDFEQIQYFIDYHEQSTNNLLWADKAFYKLCEYGHLSIAQWFLKRKPTINLNYNEILEVMCKNKGVCHDLELQSSEAHLGIAKWLFENKFITITFIRDYEKACSIACKYGHLPMVQWFTKIEPAINMEDMFAVACKHNQQHIARWIYQMKPTYRRETDSCVFVNVCESGYLNIAQWLVEIKRIHLSSISYFAFQMACQHKQIHIVKWLLDIQEVNMNAAEYMFYVACECGDLSFAQWLIEMKPTINTPTLHVGYAFQSACMNGHLSVAKWLLEIKPTVDLLHKNRALELACTYGHLHITQWLLNNEIVHFSIYLFELVCINGHLQLAQWLFNINPFLITLTYIFELVCLQGHLQLAQWLFNINLYVNINILDYLFIRCLGLGHYHIAQWLFQIKPTIPVSKSRAYIEFIRNKLHAYDDFNNEPWLQMIFMSNHNQCKLFILYAFKKRKVYLSENIIQHICLFYK
jgi:hypothetical protein